MKILVIIPTTQKFLKNSLISKLAKKNKISVSMCNFYNYSKRISLENKLLKTSANIGFTGAVNSALLVNSKSNFDWYLVLNDDAKLKEDFFRSLLPILNKKKYDVVSCGVENLQGEVESFGLKYSKTGLATPIIYSKEIDNKVFCGTCFLISKKCVTRHLEEDGYLFHPLYFAYAEDLELSVRMKENNEKIYVFPEILVTHQGSQTAKRGSAFQLYYGYRNQLLTIFFHWSVGEIIFSAPWLVLGQLYCLGITIKKRHFKVYPRIIWFFIKNCRSLLFERKKLFEATISKKKVKRVRSSRKLKILCFLISISVSLYGSFFIAEKYYFDKIFFNKSWLHGYFKGDLSNVAQIENNNVFFYQRIKYLLPLFFNDQKVELKNKDEINIAIIGDSLTYGEGVRWTQAFPYVLEKQLQRRGNFKVITLAQPGDDVIDNFTKYKLAKKIYKPDIIIFTLFNNDLIEMQDAKYPEQDKIYEDLKKACKQEPFEERVNWKNFNLTQYTDLLENSISPKYGNVCYLSEIMREISIDKSVIFYMLDNCPDKDSENDPNLSRQEKVTADICKTFIKVSQESKVNLYKFTDFKKPFKSISEKEFHPSSETHSYYANQLFDIITTVR